MGTSCHVMAHGDRHPAREAVAMVIAMVADLEARWSRFLPDSELCAINRGAGAPVGVSPATLLAVREAEAARASTDGWFDPTILPSLRAAGYDRDFDEVVCAAASRTLATHPAGRAGGAIEVDLHAGTVMIEPGSAIDLGGIGKGLAADLAATSACEMRGVIGACVSLGGDLRAVGEASGEGGWGVAIEDPARTDRVIASVALAAGGLATSSTGKRRWSSPDGVVHHLIDPRSGRPAGDTIRSVTVIAASGVAAEALATAAIVAGPSVGRRLLDDAGLPALLVEDHLVEPLNGVEDYLR